MTVADVPSRFGLLLRAAVGSDDVASASWREVEATLDLDGLSGQAYDAVCLFGVRVNRLSPGGVDRGRVAGITRHAWVSNQTVFAESFKRADELPPVLTGRWATIAHLPDAWILPAGAAPDRGRWRGPTVSAELAGHVVAVPTIAAQLVEMLITQQWVDAACLLAVAAATDVEVEAARRRRGVAVSARLAVLAELLGPATPALPRIEPRPIAAARERFWTAVFERVLRRGAGQVLE